MHGTSQKSQQGHDRGPRLGALAQSRLRHRRHGTQFSHGGEHHRETCDETRPSVSGQHGCEPRGRLRRPDCNGGGRRPGNPLHVGLDRSEHERRSVPNTQYPPQCASTNPGPTLEHRTLGAWRETRKIIFQGSPPRGFQGPRSGVLGLMHQVSRRVFIKDPGGSLSPFPVTASMEIATPHSTSLVLLEESCPRSDQSARRSPGMSTDGLFASVPRLAPEHESNHLAS